MTSSDNKAVNTSFRTREGIIMAHATDLNESLSPLDIPDSFIITEIDISRFDQWLISLDCKDSQTLLNFALELAKAKYQNPPHIKVDRLIERRGFYFPILIIHAHNGNVYYENSEKLIMGQNAKGVQK